MKYIVLIVLAVFVHSLLGLYIDKYKVLSSERVNNYSLIPFANVYLFGKCVFNRIVGIVLLIALIFVVDFSVILFGIKYGFSILPDGIRSIMFLIYAVGFVILLIYSIRKYNAITNEKDKFKFENMFYYLKETLWIVIFLAVVYLIVLLLVYGSLY